MPLVYIDYCLQCGAVKNMKYMLKFHGNVKRYRRIYIIITQQKNNLRYTFNALSNNYSTLLNYPIHSSEYKKFRPINT